MSSFFKNFYAVLLVFQETLEQEVLLELLEEQLYWPSLFLYQYDIGGIHTSDICYKLLAALVFIIPLAHFSEFNDLEVFSILLNLTEMISSLITPSIK